MAYEDVMREITEGLSVWAKERDRKLRIAKERPINAVVKCKACGSNLELRGPPIAKSYFYSDRQLIGISELPAIGTLVRCECGKLNRFDFDWHAYRWLTEIPGNETN